ncbi:MAG: ATP-dependent DNA ligase [Phycisphaerales bacterium]|nr:ATP-dependent DNA ligase [Phycisphaerales bacterium]
MVRAAIPNIEPMEALAVREIPDGPGWQYEPKWDGFRCLAFRDGKGLEMLSKSGRPLGRYFPEIEEALLALTPRRFVLDGELVVPIDGVFSFEDLQLRLHPARSRVNKLAAGSPAEYLVFDLLIDERGRAIAELPLSERRPKLEAFAAAHLPAHPRLKLSPVTTDVAQARKWLAARSLGQDGVIAKRTDLPYQAGNREGMQKVKNIRSADCVVGGFRFASRGDTVGSLLLGLYDDEDLLHHVGFTSSFPRDERDELTAKLRKLQRKRSKERGFTGRAPGAPSRWSTERSAQWEPLRPELVVEVTYDHFSGDRFRHGTKFIRWRPDKRPDQCRMDQVRR